MALAQLYKMTLYICDLEENLSLEEIKRLIKDDALDGISTSCVTHFANEKVGAHVEWDDDIDINYTNSTTEQWENILTMVSSVFCVTMAREYALTATGSIA